MSGQGVRRLAVAGPGLMGLGLAQRAAAAGIDVLLLGRDAASAQAGRQRLAGLLAQHLRRGRLSAATAAERLARVAAADGDAALAGCDLAVECVPEDRDLKQAVLQRLQAGLPAGTLIASNTSGLPIAGLAQALRRPERFLGLHFFSPVERMPLVEVVRGLLTSQATLAEALAFVAQLGQQPVVVRDGPGFFTSRVFAAYLDEALAMVGEGVHAAAIEQAALALGRPIGALAVLDEIGLALNLQQARQARADGLPRHARRPLAEPVLARLVAQGRAGRRQGGGFIDVAADGSRTPWPGLATLFPPAAVQPDAGRIAQRLRWAEALEALRCLEHGVIASADDADAASCLGLGFPAASGGVLRWVEAQGLPFFVHRARALAAAHGERFEPSAWLCALAAADSTAGGLSAYRGEFPYEATT